MKKWKISNWYFIFYLCIVCFCFPISASASSYNEAYSLTLNNAAGEGIFSVYKVADFSETGEFQITETFFSYIDTVTEMAKLNSQEELNSEEWNCLAETLSGCVAQDHILETRILKTENKTVTWTESEGLEKALYLIIGKPVTEDARYTMLPYLITVPNRDESGQWNSQVAVDLSKFSQTILDNYKVLKIWKDEGHEKQRPKKITVELLKDGESVDTQILNADNNWQYEWDGLESGHEWKVVEKNIPASYTMSNTLDGQTYVIVNTFKSKTPGTSTGGSTLPQTGQLWWPVPILAVLGLTSFMIGWVRRREFR